MRKERYNQAKNEGQAEKRRREESGIKLNSILKPGLLFFRIGQRPQMAGHRRIIKTAESFDAQFFPAIDAPGHHLIPCSDRTCCLTSVKNRGVDGTCSIQDHRIHRKRFILFYKQHIPFYHFFRDDIHHAIFLFHMRRFRENIAQEIHTPSAPDNCIGGYKTRKLPQNDDQGCRCRLTRRKSSQSSQQYQAIFVRQSQAKDAFKSMA